LRRLLKVFLSLLISTAIASATAQPKIISTVSWTPAKIASGSPCLFKVTLDRSAASVNAAWQGQQIQLFPSDDQRVWYGLAGVDVETKPGSYKLEVAATQSDGQVSRVEREVSVAPAGYKTEVLRVPQKYVKPSPEAMVRIEADRKLKKEAFSHEIPAAEWSGSFDVPVDTKPSEGFGTRRTFNGQLASIHRGMDYHAPPGTPIMAANSGVVVLARELYYEGNCVIINHGQQFMTMYLHLSRMDVKEGDKVVKGQEVGLSGATGRATGPHLHVAVRWQNAYLDPAQLWALPLPTLPTEKQSTASSRQ
jgi:murein DD-endopeptidase MepM/ murein hydrolase activator NlpD